MAKQVKKKAKPKRTKATLKKNWKRVFIEALSRTGVVGRASEAAGVCRNTAYEHRESDEAFAKQWEQAIAIYIETLEEEADRRAVEGITKPTGWYQGAAGGVVREYSDTLLMFRLKALAPEKYRERFDVEASGKGGKPLEHVHFYIPSNGRESS